MTRPKFEQLAWPDRATDEIVRDDASGDATTALLAELEAGRQVALGNLAKPLDAATLEKYRAVADAFRRAQTVVATLWKSAHDEQMIPPGLRPFIGSSGASGVIFQRS